MKNVRSILNVVYNAEIGELGKVDFYLPDSDIPCPLFIYFHGGGLEGTGRALDTHVFEPLTAAGVAVASADYRVMPQVRFPAFIEDAACAVNFVLRHGAEYGNFTRYYIGGASAGAYLTMMLYFDHRYLEKYGIDPDRDIAGYDFDDGQPTTHYNILKYRGQDNRLVRVDEAAPVYYVQEDVDPDQKAKVILFVASDDMPNRPEQNYMLRRVMLMFGYAPEKVEFHYMDGFGHCGYMGNAEHIAALLRFFGC